MRLNPTKENFVYPACKFLFCSFDGLFQPNILHLDAFGVRDATFSKRSGRNRKCPSDPPIEMHCAGEEGIF